MTAPRITPARALELKREAADMKIARGIKQSAALAQIAQREGFRSWEELAGLAGGRAAIDAAKREEPITEEKAQQIRKRSDRKARYSGDQE